MLKLSEETDLDILNNCMETMVEQYQTELLPVAAELTARLVRKSPENDIDLTPSVLDSVTPTLDLQESVSPKIKPMAVM